jgi:uncharacterized membrane protein
MLLFIIIATLIFIFYFFTYSLMLIAYLISTTTRAFYTFKISPHPALLIIVNVAGIISSIIYQEFLSPQFKINMRHRSFNQRFRSFNPPDS